MIWLTWRQFRAQTAVAVMALTAFAVILGVTGPDLAHAYAASGLASCRANCTSLASTFLSQMRSDAVYPLLYFAGGAALYHDTFTCIPSGLPYRPARTTPGRWPSDRTAVRSWWSPA